MKKEAQLVEQEKRRKEQIAREAMKQQAEEDLRRKKFEKKREEEEDRLVAQQPWANWGSEDRGKLIREKNNDLLREQIEINRRRRTAEAKVTWDSPGRRAAQPATQAGV